MIRYAEPNVTPEMIEQQWEKTWKEFGEDWLEELPDEDLEVTFNFENFSTPWCKDFGEHVGFYDVNGTTIALCIAGGDWETPVYFALFLEKDTKKIRMYTPFVGNHFDFYCKTAFGSQGDFGDIDPDTAWPEELREDADKMDDWEDYVIQHVNVEDMLADIAAHIEGATPCVPCSKEPLWYDAIKGDASND